MLNATRVLTFEGKQLCSPPEPGGVLAMQGISASSGEGTEHPALGGFAQPVCGLE